MHGERIVAAQYDDFPGRLKREREKAGLTESQFAVRARLSIKQLEAYESGERTPRVQTVKQLCSALGVDYKTLTGIEEPYNAQLYNDIPGRKKADDSNRPSPIKMGIDRDREKIVEIMDKLDDGDRRAVLNLAQTLLFNASLRDMGRVRESFILTSPDDTDESVDTEKFILDNIDSLTRHNFVHRSSLPDRSTGFITVEGNGMEPMFPDGSRVYIEETEHLNVGEIGMFEMDGRLMARVLGENCLYRLNPFLKEEDRVIKLTEKDKLKVVARVLGLVREEDYATDEDFHRIIESFK